MSPVIELIIPAYNEEAAIAEVVGAVPRDLVSRVIVVDNGSTDATGRVARDAGAEVVREERRGYGSACLAGVRALERAEIVVFLDGDRSDDPSEVRVLVDVILADRADFVIGTRTSRMERGALTPQQLVGNRVATALIRWLYGVRLSDIGSFRAIRRDALLSLGMSNLTYGWPVEMVVRAAKHRYRIAEVPITYRRRIGESKVSGTLAGSVLAGYHMLTTILRYALVQVPRS
jgi:glycosyltransferase involved in cell wall biosynthesis